MAYKLIKIIMKKSNANFVQVTNLTPVNGVAKLWDIIVTYDDDTITVENTVIGKRCTNEKNLKWNLGVFQDWLYFLLKYEMDEALKTHHIIQVSRIINN